MAFKQGFESRSIQLQEGLLSSMAKIEALAANNTQAIEVITGGVVSTVRNLEKLIVETEKQTAVLKRIEANIVLSNAKLDAVSKGVSTQRTGAAEKLQNVAAGLGTTAKNVLLMAAAIGAFGIAIGIASAFVLNPVGVIAISLALGIIVPAFAYAAEKMKDLDEKQIRRAAVALPLVALGIVGSALILSLMPTLTPSMAPDPIWTLKAGLALALFAIPFALVASKKLENIKQLALTAASIPLIALGLVGAAYAFSLLPDEYKAPDPIWSLKVGLSILVFSLPFVLAAATIDKFNLGPKDILFASLAGIAIAATILGVAYLFQMLPEEYKAPDLGWMFSVGIGMIPFALTIGIIGAIVRAVTIQGFLLGAAGLVVAGLAVVGLAYVLQLLPEGMFKPGGLLYNVADALSYFGMRIVDVFLYLLEKGLPIFKEVIRELGPFIGDLITKVADPLKVIFSGIAEVVQAFVPIFQSAFEMIGNIIVSAISNISVVINSLGDFIEKMANIGAGNLVALGGGLLAVAGGLAAIAAATLGASLGGAVSSVFNAAGALISFISGTAPAMTPEEIVLSLSDRVNAIQETGKGIDNINSALRKINAITDMQGLSAFYIALDKFFPSGYEDYAIPTLFAGSIQKMNKQLATLIKYKNPLQQMALSFQSIATSMQTFSAGINSIQIEKSQKVYDVLSEINELADKNSGFNKVINFASDTVDKALTFAGGIANKITGGGDEKVVEGKPTNSADMARLTAAINNLPGNIAQAVGGVRLELRDATGGKLLASS